MAEIKSFRDLDVYQAGLSEAKKIFVVTKLFPSEAKFSLISQIRRCSRGTTALIAEAWARRKYVASFEHKLDEALGEANETQSWLDHALLCDYITREQHGEMDDKWQHIGAMINPMIQNSESFCRAFNKR